MGDFAYDTAITPLGDGRFTADLSPDWEIWGPNGGYLAAIALRAAGAVAKIARPASFTCHFLRVAKFAQIEIEAEVLHAGRSAESIRVSMTQDGRRIIEALVRTAAPVPGLSHVDAVAPLAPEPLTQPQFEDLAPDAPRFPFWRNLESRIVNPAEFNNWRETRPPRFLEWFRYRPRATFDDPWIEAGRLALMIDTMSWPAAGRAHPNAPFTAPSLETSVWFHDLGAATDWLLVEEVSPIAAGGLVSAHGRVWSRERRLLASGGAQLLCVPRPPVG